MAILLCEAKVNVVNNNNRMFGSIKLESPQGFSNDKGILELFRLYGNIKIS